MSAKQNLNSPIPLRLSRQTVFQAKLAERVSGLKRADVLRRAIDAGLPLVLRRFAQTEKETR